jgi:uncharacterized repeat protein (TIGR01451 family)
MLLPKSPFTFKMAKVRVIAATVLLGSFSSSPSLAQVKPNPVIINQAFYTYQGSGDDSLLHGQTPSTSYLLDRLIDPLGRVTGCAGETLPDYQGFSVGLYEPNPNDPTGSEIQQLTPLTPTELPDLPGNGISKGIEPNIENSNPFFLTNSNKGYYSFLLDPSKGQLDAGRAYILLINPPPRTVYNQRRIKIVINGRLGNEITYTATALDDKPISTTDGRTSITESITIQDAERIGLNLAVLNFASSICQAQEVQLIKTGDRAAAEPGDTVIYRLSVRNLAAAPINNVVISDRLPLGMEFLKNSVRAESQGQSISVDAVENDSLITFTTNSSIQRDQILNIAYAVRLTPDSIRGTGQNSAIVKGQRSDNGLGVKDGPATHQLRIRPGILSDCGTIIGRVFEDKNFDGEQQSGEPGIPNAVILMDDGSRITTDPNGLFSVANVISGYRTAALDLSSLPDFTLAPNHRFKERNSQSRLVHLEPGGLVRLNFAVTPASRKQR